MNNSIKNIPPLTEKDLECLAELEKMSDEDIDYSDIPKITHEWFQKAIAKKRARLSNKNLNVAS
ncbi:MAG: hypothetical protein IKZ58_09600 [Selenomonadaceae bacterium]|nr:hypothetical protein [Selenomonadaceae bacterium]